MKRSRVSSALLGWAVVHAADNDSKSEPTFIRRTQLPVYSEEIKPEIKKKEENDTMIMKAVTSIRKDACKVARIIKSATDRCNQFIDTGVAHSYSSYENATEYLRDEKNILPRIGAIGSGVVVGYVLGRRGFIKRLVYSCIGGGSVAAVCYPKEANIYYEMSLQLSKRYFIIGYHFLNGVSKDFVGYELPALSQKTQESPNKNSSKSSE